MGGVTHRCDVQISLTHRSVSEENTHGTDRSRDFPSFVSDLFVVILSTSDIKGNEARPEFQPLLWETCSV